MISYCQEVGIRGSLSSSLVPFVLYYYNDYKAYHQTAGRSGHQDSHLTNSLRSGTRESRVSSQGSAHVELETSEVEKLRIVVQQMIGESQAFLLDAIKSMLVEVKRNTGRSESGGAEGSAAVGKSPEGAGPTALRQSLVGAGPTAVRETIFVTEVCGIRGDGTRRSCCSCRVWSREGSAKPARDSWRDGCIP